MKLRLDVLSLVLVIAACATTDRPPAADPTRTIVEREQRLLTALAQQKRSVINNLLAPDFRCGVAGSEWFTYDREPSRSLACTGVRVIHGPDPRAPRPRWLGTPPNQGPRWATIDTIEVKLGDQQAIVESTQTYSNWWPYSRMDSHRARVTDTWMLRNGEWKLHRRFSEPLAKEVAER